MRRISGSNTLDLGSGRLGYRDRNLALGQPGTVVPGTHLTDFQEEIARPIEISGQVLDPNNREQLAEAIRRLPPGRLLRVLTFNTAGAATYTPDARMGFVRVTAIGGGGSGGGAPAGTGGNISAGAAGGAGTVGQGVFTTVQVGASITVTVGAGGTPASGVPGGAGGTTSFGSLMTTPGGNGGGSLANATPPTHIGPAGLSAAASGANLWSGRGAAEGVTQALSAGGGFGGAGGRSHFGAGGSLVNFNGGANAAVSPGSGGSGLVVAASGSIFPGGAGAPGLVIIEEFSL